MITREELLDILERLVRRGKLTEQEAGDILRKYDEGEFTEDDLPLDDSDALILITLGILFLSLMPPHLLSFSLPARSRYDERFRAGDDLLATAEQLAAKLAKDRNYRAFHSDAMEAVKENLIRQLVLGKGAQLTPDEIARAQAGTLTREEIRAITQRVITPNDIQRVQDEALNQSAYLKRFVEEAAAREKAGKPYNEAYVKNRFQMYGGAGIGMFFQTIEAPLGPGWVINYIAIDDDFTCTPCIKADEEGPYLPGEGPLPGVICLGKRRCRCNRVPEFNPDEYRRLISEAG